jgi:hypothetical protein
MYNWELTASVLASMSAMTSMTARSILGMDAMAAGRRVVVYSGGEVQ